MHTNNEFVLVHFADFMKKKKEMLCWIGSINNSLLSVLSEGNLKQSSNNKENIYINSQVGGSSTLNCDWSAKKKSFHLGTSMPSSSLQI